MPIAAVPKYLGNDFKDASPGMRFGLLLPIWTERQDQEAEVRKRAEAKSREGGEVAELLKKQGMDATIQALRQRERRSLPSLWDKNDFTARSAWDRIKSLTKSDRDRMKALADRQDTLAATVHGDALRRFDALAKAPFTTGLGNEHPLENGFAFLNPYGLPYLPGSGVKGVLRQAARELASGDWGEAHGWSEEKQYTLMEGEGEKRRSVLDKNKQPVMLSMLDVLLGRESGNGDTDHVRGALSFWDVIPQIAPEDPKKPDQISLMVEIMTPHQSHYYQWKKDQRGNLIEVAPHESGQPNPICFLTVPPGSGFTFHVVCDLAHLRRLAPDLAESGRWKTMIQAAFEHAFTWLGFGAKTAVGYGAMITEAQMKAREVEAEKCAAQAKENARKEEEKRQAEQAVQWQGARIKFNRSNGALTVEKDGKTANALQPKGQELLATLPKDVQNKVLANQFLKITAYVSGSMLVRVEFP